MPSSITPHLKVVQHPNPLVRSFHIVREIIPVRKTHWLGEKSHYNHGEDPGYDAKAIAERLESIRGVAEGRLEQYEISVNIGDAFDWNDVGPLVVGEIVRSVYPEVEGGMLDVSIRLGWSYRTTPRPFDFDDDGHRIAYRDTVDRIPVKINLDPLEPILNIEHLLGREALAEAKAAARQQGE